MRAGTTGECRMTLRSSGLHGSSIDYNAVTGLMLGQVLDFAGHLGDCNMRCVQPGLAGDNSHGQAHQVKMKLLALSAFGNNITAFTIFCLIH